MITFFFSEMTNGGVSLSVFRGAFIMLTPTRLNVFLLNLISIVVILPF